MKFRLLVNVFNYVLISDEYLYGYLCKIVVNEKWIGV